MFIHHPDGYIVIDNSIYPMNFWLTVEPGYALPQGNYVGRIFVPGIKNHLIRSDRNEHESIDLLWQEGSDYIAKKSIYDNALAASRNGAFVENVDGNVVVSGPPSISSDVPEIDNDGVEQVVITVDVGDAAYTGLVIWDIFYPDGNSFQDQENAVSGVSQLTLTTLQEGNHTIKVFCDGFGESSISIFGV